MAALLKNCFLNGDFQDLENATVSVLDRGFIFGDAIYEVIPVFNGVAFHLELHLQRLAASMKAARIAPVHDDKKWLDLTYELIERNGGGDQSLYLQITRGVAPRDHAIPENISPTIFMFCAELNHTETQPIAAVTAEDTRWQHCDIKATSLLANVLLRSQAVALQAEESILIRDGNLTEGAASNVFLVIDNAVYTSVENNYILAGITRRLLIDILSGTSMRIAEQEIPRNLLEQAQEIWITSSSKDIVPVTKLDGKDVGTGEVGELFLEAQKVFQAYKKDWLDKEAQALGL